MTGILALTAAMLAIPFGAHAASNSLEEVIVTAEKEPASLQRTAAAITRLSPETLVDSGIGDLPAAQMLVPGVRFQVEGNSTQVFIRGVGTALDLANIEPNVAFNFNGIYAPREGTSSALFDLAGMEVLPGPQGTLYGRSAVGGTVNVDFRRPAHDWAGNTELELGNYSLWHVTVAQDVPLTPTLALRAAINYTSHDGYEASGADSQRDPAVRLSLLFSPSDDFTVYLWSSDARKFGAPPNLVNKGTDPGTGRFAEPDFLFGNPWDDLQNRPIPGLPSSTAGFGNPAPQIQTYRNFQIGGQVDWKIGPVTLSYLPGYTYLDSASNYWLGVLPAYLAQHYNIASNELRLRNAPGGPFDWLLGLTSYDQHNIGYFSVLGVVVNSDIRDNHLAGEAVFGQGTYHFSDRLRVTLGGRFSAEQRQAVGFQTADAATLAPLGPFTFDRSYTHFDWKAAVEYDLSPKAMAYFASQTGYQPGTYNSQPGTPQFDNAVAPEHLTAFTAGLKSRLLEDTVQFNPEIFYYDYRDLIEQQYDANVAFNPLFNAQSVHIYGAQLDWVWKPTRSDVINLTPAYTHARNVRFRTPEGGNFDGLQTVYSPDVTAIGGYTHEFPFAAGTLVARIEARYEGSFWATYGHNPGTRQSSSVKEDLTFSYESDQHWSIGLWGKNLSNRAVIAATASGGYPGPALAYLEAPRTFGLRARYTY